MTQHVTFRWDDEVFFRSNLFTNVLFFLRLKPIHPGFKLPVSEKNQEPVMMQVGGCAKSFSSMTSQICHLLTPIQSSPLNLSPVARRV